MNENNKIVINLYPSFHNDCIIEISANELLIVIQPKQRSLEGIDKKEELILAFRSQFFDPSYESEELQTPISGKDFLLFLRAKARTYGRAAGFEYAEGFNIDRTIGVRDLFQLQ